MRRIAAVAFLTVGLVAGCGSTAASAPPRTITGTFTLTDSSGILKTTGADGSPCAGKGGYDDIDTGTQVVVSDGSGKTLATGALGTGSYQKNPTYPILGECEFPVVVDAEIPKAEFYSVAVGRRGELKYSFDEMEQRGWVVEFTLG